MPASDASKAEDKFVRWAQHYQNGRMEVFKNQTLNQILQAELDSGNEVAEKSAWPPNCQTLVILKSRFFQQHDWQSDIVYRVINDRHYWYAEYATEDGAECLACRF